VSAHCFSLFPPPDPGPLEAIADPIARTRSALEQLYAHWERMAPMVRPVLRDAELAPERVSLKIRDRYVNRIRAVVRRGFPSRMRARASLRDAVRHAFDFRTWDALSRGGFTRQRAVALMTALVASGSDSLITERARKRSPRRRVRALRTQ
jgi:hypothetical protein